MSQRQLIITHPSKQASPQPNYTIMSTHQACTGRQLPPSPASIICKYQFLRLGLGMRMGPPPSCCLARPGKVQSAECYVSGSRRDQLFRADGVVVVVVYMRDEQSGTQLFS